MKQRFIPAEFGNDVDRSENAVEPIKSLYEAKSQIRRSVEAQGIPYTYIIPGCFSGSFLSNLVQLVPSSVPPRDKVIIIGDGNVKGTCGHLVH